MDILYVLLALIEPQTSTTSKPSLVAIEFKSQATCETAGEELVKMHKELNDSAPMSNRHTVKYTCVKK